MGGILDNASLLGTTAAVLFIVMSVADMIKSDAPAWVKPVVAILFAPPTVFALLVYQGATFTPQTWAGLALLSVFAVGSVLGIDYARARRIADQTRQATLTELEVKQAMMRPGMSAEGVGRLPPSGSSTHLVRGYPDREK